MNLPPDLPPEFLQLIANQGRNGDTELAHVNPREKAMLKAMGGAGTINPRTGLREYYDEGGGTAEGSYGGGFTDPNEGTNNQGTGGAGAGTGGDGGGFPGAEPVGMPPVQGPPTPSLGDRFGAFVSDPFGSISASLQSAYNRFDPQDAALGAFGVLAGPVGGMVSMARGAQAINDRFFGGQARTDLPDSRATPDGGGTAGTNPQGAAMTSTIPGLTPGVGITATPYYPGDLGIGRRVFAYAEGGQVGPGGVPSRPGVTPKGQPQSAPNAQMLMAEAQRFAQQNPQQVAQIKSALQQELQTGEMNMQQLAALVQLAMVALQQPEMYPTLRAAAIRQGLAQEDDLPQKFDTGLLFILLLVGQAAGINGSQAQGQMQMAPPAMASGGALPARSPASDGSFPIKAHEGEYVIPAHVVRAKGTEFFDKLIQGAGAPKGQP